MNQRPSAPVALAMMKRTLSTLVAAALWMTGVMPAYALESGARMPAIALRDLNGRQLSAADLQGKVVVVDFWASWCAPCREELPVLQRLYERYKAQGLVVVGVSVDREASNAKTFAQRLGLSFPLVHDAEHSLAGRFAPPKMPTSYIVDRRGVVKNVHAGFRAGDAAAIEREIQALLAQR